MCPRRRNNRARRNAFPGFIRDLGLEHQVLKLLAVLVELFLIELVLQELGYDFRLQ